MDEPANSGTWDYRGRAYTFTRSTRFGFTFGEAAFAENCGAYADERTIVFLSPLCRGRGWTHAPGFDARNSALLRHGGFARFRRTGARCIRADRVWHIKSW